MMHPQYSEEKIDLVATNYSTRYQNDMEKTYLGGRKQKEWD